MSNRPKPQNPQQHVFENVKVEGNLTTGDIHQTINVQEVPSHKPEITLQWMRQNFEEVKANAGARYTPEIHVDLPEAWVFEGLGRTDTFFDRIQSLYGQLYRSNNKAKSNNALHQRFPTIAQSLKALHQPIAALITALQQIDRDSLLEINFQNIDELAAQAKTEEQNFYTATWDAESSLKTDASQAVHQTEPTYRSDKEIIGDVRHNVSQLLAVVRKIAELATIASAEAANKKALLLLGEAGTGKTHLFCDVAKRRLEQELPTIMLLGQHFNQSEPWAQILQRLQLPFRDRDEFLTALEIAAQVRGKRALILIDALNEGNGKHLWRNELPGILRVLENYPRIGLAVSCRTSYERIVIPESLIPDSMTQVNHRGFADHEYIATTTFFNHYGIERPSVPLLKPEFSNPLFLKIFCQGLSKRKLIRIPRGLQGITAIFNFFIDSVHEALCHKIDYDPSENLAQQATNLIAQSMAITGFPWVERSEASKLVNTLLPGRGYSQSLFANLLSEGLLSEDLAYLPANSAQDEDFLQIDVIKFPYERFSDHLTVRYLLHTHLDDSNPVNSFTSTQPLGNLVADENQAWRNSGWVEAMSVQIPERAGIELVELVPSAKAWDITKRAFLQSLIWRDSKKITESTKDYLNEVYIEGDSIEDVYDLMLTIATEPDHPFNANFLHQHLMKLDMPDRDQAWSIYLSQNYSQESAIDRLLEWAWDAEKNHISDESIELCVIALTWFLTASHRYVRDRATKALVSTLYLRPHILSNLIEHFVEVNDLYVAERLCAVAYSVSMMSDNSEAIGELASRVYTWIFAKGEPPVHILLRDYALGVIETANHRGALPPDIDIEKARPPYKSEWLANIPSEEELKASGKLSTSGRDFAGGGLTSIKSSVMGFGDFARYIIGTNHGFFPWSSCRLSERKKAEILVIRKQKTEEFVNSLTERQRHAWGEYETIQHNIQQLKRQDEAKQIEILGQAFSTEQWDEFSVRGENRFLRTLGKKKQQCFKDYVLPHKLDPQGNKLNFDLAIAQRWIFQRVFELGWTEEKFDWFDRHLNRNGYGRHANKTERIGKKYQWIAYHEFLAYVADNFEFIGDEVDDFEAKYNGSWQISARDIDPSMLLRKIPNEDRFNNSFTWWKPIQYEFSEATPEDKTSWLVQKEDFLDPFQLLEVIHPASGRNWLTLEGYYNWKEQGPVEEERYEGIRRNMWFQVRSYIARQADSEELLEWLKEQNFMGRWMPESVQMDEVYVGEFPWATASTQFRSQENIWGRQRERLPAPVIVTTVNYLCESSTHDCSIDETISALMPSAWLIENMGLRWSAGNFRYVDSSDELTTFDPSVEEAGPSALLISKEKLASFLEEHQLVLIWTILGERLLTNRYEWTGNVEMSAVHSFQNGILINGSLKAWQRLAPGEKFLLE